MDGFVCLCFRPFSLPLFPPPSFPLFFFFCSLVGPPCQEAHEKIAAQSVALAGLRRAALGFREKATLASRSSRPVSPKVKRLRLCDPEEKTTKLTQSSTSVGASEAADEEVWQEEEEAEKEEEEEEEEEEDRAFVNPYLAAKPSQAPK